MVEDDQMVRAVTFDMLTMLGCKVICAKDGVQAMHIFLNNRINISLILTDVCMPRKNGFQLIYEIRRINKSVPIILYTGYNKLLRKPFILSRNPPIYLQKPFTLTNLQIAIEKGLNTTM